MRPPACRWAAVSRVFSTSPSATKSAPTLQPIQSLVPAGRLQDSIRSLILRRHLGQPVHHDCFVAILKQCAAAEAPLAARQLHAHMIVTCFDQDTFICNHLIGVYGKFGSLAYAHCVFTKLRKKKVHSWNILIALYCKFGFLSEGRRLFDEMPRWDAVSWNTMIAAYDQWGPCEEALEIFVRMTRSGCEVDNFGLSSAISACANLRFLQSGEVLHGFSVKLGLDSNIKVGSAVVEIYSKCGKLEDARRAFDQMGTKELFTWNTMLDGYIQCSKISDALSFFDGMPEKNVVSWTTIVAGCSRHNRNEKAIEFFHNMQKLGLRPDWVSFVSVLDACVRLLDLREGSKIQAEIVKSGFAADRIIGSTLVALYAKGGFLTDARAVSQSLAAVDDYTWSVLISEYVKHGLSKDALELFESLSVKSVELWNALIAGYSAVGLSEEASATYNRMQMDGKSGDEFTFGSLLAGGFHLGLRFGEQFHSHVIKLGFDFSVFLASALIIMYSTNLNCQAAERIFKLAVHRNPIVWTSMISGYAINDLTENAMHTFSLMIASGIQPDNVSLSLIIDSCSRLLHLHGGKQVHAFSYRLGLESDIVVGTALIDMYAKCGSIDCASHAFADIHEHTVFSWTSLLNGYMRLGMFDTANKLFDMMPERNNVSWNVIIYGYGKHGLASQSLHTFSQMGKSGILPDRISFIALLEVCTHSVLEESGKQVHAQIIKNGYHMNDQIKNFLSCMYQKFGEFCHGDKSSSGSCDSIIMDAAVRTEQDIISENIKLLASVYFSHFSAENLQDR